MSRYNDPDSGTTSFSILLGNAPHLDKTYAVFGEIVAGDEVLSKLEQLPTKKEVRERMLFYAVGRFVFASHNITLPTDSMHTRPCEQGIFVMPTERITISASYVYEAKDGIPVRLTYVISLPHMQKLSNCSKSQLPLQYVSIQLIGV